MVLTPELKIEILSPTSSDFEEVLRLRMRRYRRPAAGERDELDAESIQVVARFDGRIVGAVRMTDTSAPGITLNAYYPEWLLEICSHRLFHCSRFCVDMQGIPSSTPVSGELIRFGMNLSRQLRFPVLTSMVRMELVPYWFELGCSFVRDHLVYYDFCQAHCCASVLHCELSNSEIATSPSSTQSFDHFFRNDSRLARSREEMFLLFKKMRRANHEKSSSAD